MIDSNFKIKYSKGFQIELRDAVRWYNLQKKGLGAELRAEVKRVIENIVLNPTFASIKYDDTRVVACETFPYTIHYEIDILSNKIRVLTFFHTKRKPTWL